MTVASTARAVAHGVRHPGEWLRSVTGGAPVYPLVVLFGLNAVDELDRTAFGILVPEIRDEFGLDLQGVLTLIAFVSLCALVLQVPIAMLADRYNRVRLAWIGAAAWAVFSLGTGFATGIVTDSYIWDATPAAFVAHVEDRDDAATILEQLAASRLDVLFGELEDVGEGPVPEREATEALLARRFELLDEDLRLPETMTQPVAAIFPEDSVQDESSTPNLTALVATALARLDALERPFLLLVESEEVDSASHRHASQRLLRGLRSIESALLTVLDFAAKRPGTLVLFTSDHETGGLAVGYDVQRYPDLRLLWSTKDHTAALVPLMAIGPGATQFTEVTRAWQVGELLRAMVADIRPAPASSAFSAAAGEPVEDSAEDSRPY